MSELILPTIGSSGYYELRAPLDTKITLGERYTCQAVRKIRDYLANNEDVKKDVYTFLGIETQYDIDLNNDVYIVSLQSDKGHWLYIPASFIVGYPNTNGIPYRTLMIAASLPSVPADRDLSFLETDIANLITDALGVMPVMKQVETSRVVLVDKAQHDITQAQRAMVSSGRVTDRSRYTVLLQEHQTALSKIALLEEYIKTHYVP